MSPRDHVSEAARADFAEFTPNARPFLGQATYIQLELFERLSRALIMAPNIAHKERLANAARDALDKYQALSELVRDRGGEPVEEMGPFVEAMAIYRASTSGSSYPEMVLALYVTGAMLDDFFDRLAAGLRGGLAQRVRAVLAQTGVEEAAGALAADILAAEPYLADSLALWSRCLVGDTLLVARGALGSAAASHHEQVEPVFTTLMAGHTRRMDALGLTA